MPHPLNPALAATAAPAVMEAYRWLDATPPPADKPMINISQAAPVDPPPLPLRRAMAEAVIDDPGAHLYGPDLGLPALRDELARQISAHYGGSVTADQVAITAGCNQAFTAAIASLASAGDAVILPSPWYFNHKMWLDMSGIETRVLDTGPDLIPDPDAAAALITDRTRAIVLVSPNNPAGTEYPAETLRAFFDLARRHGIALILDETYRDFDSRSGAPHDLFADPDWHDTLIHLYSFSKAYRLTGHRVGAIATSTARLAEVEKYLDATTICANQLGQRAALWGMRNLGQWLAGERAEIMDRRAAMADHLAALPGWTLRGIGAYFAYVDHPFDAPSVRVAQRLVAEQGVLLLPASMFTAPGDPVGTRACRFAFANIDRAGMDALFARLRNLTL